MSADVGPTAMESYDYVVVGGGSAGCVVAARLSADPGVEVLLIEAGPDDSATELALPPMWTSLLGGSYDWGYLTVPQPHADGRSVYWPRGRVLGGSSSINAMVFMRGAAADFDAWAAAGCAGWDFESVLPAFLELESYALGGLLRGEGGPLALTVPDDVSPLSRAVLDAALERGYTLNPDPNQGHLDGVGWNQLTVSEGVRQSSSRAFLAPVRHRTNLTVRTSTHATRLLFDSSSSAYGVEVRTPDGTTTIGARREVVLSGGTIETPRLLMLSGVGSAEDLHRLGVPVIVDLPGVGKNLHDHTGVPITYASPKPVPVGPNQASEVFLFCHSDEAPATGHIPDIQFGVLTVALTTTGQVADHDGFTFYPSHLKPHSRGTVRLRSADPFDPPLIDPAYLSDSRDVAALRVAIARSRELASAPAMQPWVQSELWPGTNCSDAELDAYIRRAVNTWYHPVGTCRMGTDSLSVVDPALRVHGLTNVRVVDASVMPEVTSANTNAATLMIGWRAADLITGG